MESINIQEVINKYLNGEASSEEIRFIEEFYASFDRMPGLTEQLSEKELKTSIKQGFSSLLAALRH